MDIKKIEDHDAAALFLSGVKTFLTLDSHIETFARRMFFAA